MEPRRIVQLALGVPDAIDVRRRDAAAMKALAMKAFPGTDDVDELAERCAPVYEALVATLAEGGLDGWIIGSDADAKLAGQTMRSRIPSQEFTSDYKMLNEAATVGATEVVTWARNHQILDH